MASTKRILAQKRGTTSFVSAYSPAVGVRARVSSIIVANTSGADATFQICIDDDGTTYDETTTIGWKVPCGAGVIINLDFGQYVEGGLPMNSVLANLAVLSSVTNAHTYTIIGEEIT